MAIDETEIEYFRVDVREAGYAAEDFDLSENVDQPRPGEAQGVFVERGTVTVTWRKTGITRIYGAGSGTAWVVAFMEDLRAGVFGK